MSLDAVKILEINITKSSKIQILEFIQKYLFSSSQKTEKPLILVTPNPEQVVLARHDAHFREVLNRADVAIPDGVGLVWADKKNIKTTITGIDFMEELVSIAAKRHVPVALIGSRGGLAIKALECLSEKYPGLQGWAYEPSLAPLSDVEIVADRIRSSNTRMVFVGLGAPKQEYFIERLKQSLVISNQKSVTSKRIADYGLPITGYPIILMSVGGSFDEIAGKVPRAPTWVNHFGLKWLWRLVLEPWRIKRQLALIEFVWMVLFSQRKSAKTNVM